jgi:hypothetical protein
MTDLTITEQTAGSFLVEITGRAAATTHRVEVPADLAEQLGGSGTTDERLVEESFRFLLEHEPNTSILRSFSIERIGDYFPEWAAEMSRRLGT